jgi:hypothetical protein
MWCLPCISDDQQANSKQQERHNVQLEISATSTAGLHPPLDESSLLQELVAQFLAHDGYVDTARAFAGEVATETRALQNGRNQPLKKYEAEEDHEAINRNSRSRSSSYSQVPTDLRLSEIRSAILDGDIDNALKLTKTYYSSVLADYPHIHFKLRCRKFLEMMRRSNELSAATAAASKRRLSTSSSHEHAVFDQEMELDDGDGDDWVADGMDTEEPEVVAQFNQLLTEAVQYGQQLRADYPSDEHGSDKKLLDDIFSLVAYPDPKRSVHGHYLDPEGRVAVAEELNSAILGMLDILSSFLLSLLCSLHL